MEIMIDKYEVILSYINLQQLNMASVLKRYRLLVIIPLLTMVVHKWSGRLELVLRLIWYDWMMPLTCAGGFHVSCTFTVLAVFASDSVTSACRSVGGPGTAIQ